MLLVKQLSKLAPPGSPHGALARRLRAAVHAATRPPAPEAPSYEPSHEPSHEPSYDAVLRDLEQLNPDFARFQYGGAYVQDPRTYESANVHLDRVYAFARRILTRDLFWRYGPRYVHESARYTLEPLEPYTRLEGRRFCDLGCGTHHPLGISAAVYLNGAASCVATDLSGADAVRAAEALFDLLVAVLAYPDDWHWSRLTRAAFLERVRHFDLRALQQGELAAGLREVPLRHVVTDIHEPVLERDSIDVMTSRAVLEHFLDFPSAARRLFALTAPGGVACHLVDVADHRHYVDPVAYHPWAMLAEDDAWSDGLVNRLRACELRRHLADAGFEVLAQKNQEESMPAGFRERLRGRFAAMSDQELSILRVWLVLRKPG